MKIESYQYPHSSFLSVEKDTAIIVDYFLKNERLKKLLYYMKPDALSCPNVPRDKVMDMFGKQIKIVPKIKVDAPELCYVIIGFDNFTSNATNPSFRDNIISFDIVCHFDQWNLNDFQLRPYKIAAEIDSMFNNKHITTTIGTLHFLGASQIILNDELAGLSLMYEAIHGFEGEDSKFAPKPGDQLSIDQNFNEIFNVKDGI